MKYSIITLIRKLNGVSTIQKTILYTLASRMNADDICWPSLSHLAKECCLTRAALCRNLNQLIDLGIVHKKMYFFSTKSNEYKICEKRLNELVNKDCG